MTHIDVAWHPIDRILLAETGDPQLVASILGYEIWLQTWGETTFVLESHSDSGVQPPEIIGQHGQVDGAIYSVTIRIGQLLIDLAADSDVASGQVVGPDPATQASIEAQAVPDADPQEARTMKIPLASARIFAQEGATTPEMPANTVPFGDPWPEGWREVVNFRAGTWEDLPDLAKRDLALELFSRIGPDILAIIERFGWVTSTIQSLPLYPESGRLYVFLEQLKALDKIASGVLLPTPEIEQEIEGGSLDWF